MTSSVPCHKIGDSCVFQVPNASRGDDKDAELDYVAVLDSSGSMDTVWAPLARSINKLQSLVGDFHTVTFDNNSYRKYGELSERLRDNGGGLTNIKAGVELLKEVVTELRSKGSKSFLVIFVSDGYDTCGNTPESLLQSAKGFNNSGMEFTTVGVGNRFPTHLSMALRNAFHRGRVNLPNLTLVENVQDFEKIFGNLAQGILESAGGQVTLKPKVKAAPWTKPMQTVFEKTWVVLDGLAETIDMEGRQLSLVASEWNFSTGEAVMKQWINMLHAAAASGEDVRDPAQAAVGLAHQIAVKVERAAEAEVETTSRTSNPKCPSVYQRLRKKMRSHKFDLSALKKELKNLADGDMLSHLSDADLAQRLAIGMKEGKHHKRAMQWKGVDVEEFGTYLTRFQTLMDECLEALRNGPDDENRSAVSLESNRDVLLQDDLPQAISELPSQYFLVDCVPLIGQPVVIKVTDGSMINPWLVHVESVTRHTPMLDTCTILGLADENGVAHMSVGGGQTEAINAVCPLFTKEVGPVIGPFMRSKLYQMLMTHTVCKNIDTIDPDSHPALMAALVCSLLGEPPSSWREELIDKVLDTMKGVYLGRVSFKDSIASLKDTPNFTMVTDSPDLSTKCQSLSKPLLLTMCCAEDLDVQQKTAIIQRMHLEHIGRILGSGRQYSDWFNIPDAPTDVLFGSKLEFVDLGLDVKKFASLPALRKAIKLAVDICTTTVPADLDTSKIKVKFNKRKLELASKRSKDPVNFEILEAFSGWLVGQADIPSIPVETYVAHGCAHTKSYDRATHEVLDREAVRKLIIGDAISAFYKDRKTSLKKSLVDEGEALYKQNYHETHQDCVLPLSWAEICQQRAALGLEAVDQEALGYDSKTGMCKSACMCPKCGFYLMPLKSLGCHLAEMRNDSDPFVEAFHRCIFAMRHRSDREIEHACVSGKYIQRPPPRNFKKSFQERGDVLRREIALIKEKYIQMFG
ncbi:hypothetical protein BSKO_06592 [Bryopsis sp. KO-2023]|nr:hypothetical protein BSKO_06592 [Bryopsis sp. KO-2023]